jgi:hypothetical protein
VILLRNRPLTLCDSDDQRATRRTASNRYSEIVRSKQSRSRHFEQTNQTYTLNFSQGSAKITMATAIATPETDPGTAPGLINIRTLQSILQCRFAGSVAGWVNEGPADGSRSCRRRRMWLPMHILFTIDSCGKAWWIRSSLPPIVGCEATGNLTTPKPEKLDSCPTALESEFAFRLRPACAGRAAHRPSRH